MVALTAATVRGRTTIARKMRKASRSRLERSIHTALCSRACEYRQNPAQLEYADAIFNDRPRAMTLPSRSTQWIAARQTGQFIFRD